MESKAAKVVKVVRGWISLSESERREFQRFVEQYERGDMRMQGSLRESVYSSVTKLQTGPLGGTCPCCGK